MQIVDQVEAVSTSTCFSFIDIEVNCAIRGLCVRESCSLFRKPRINNIPFDYFPSLPKVKEHKSNKSGRKPAPASSAPAVSVPVEKRPFLKTKEELMSKLDSLSISFLRIDHRHVLTVDELIPELGQLPKPGVVGKNLFLKVS